MKRETRKIGKERKNITINLSSKNIILRVVIAGICLVLGISLLFNSCSNYINRSTYLSISFPTFKNIDEEEETLFDNNLVIQYYFDKDKATKGKSVITREINNLFIDNLVKSHKLLDSNDLYLENGNQMHNLKYLNDNPNTWVSLDTELYNVLKEASKLNEETNGLYSIFSGKLYDLWDEIFLKYSVDNEPLLCDPIYIEGRANKIQEIVTSINKETTYLEFKDDNNQVKFNVLDLDKDNISLNLGLLESAYYMDITREILVTNNFNSGYIANNSGMVSSLSVNPEGGFWDFNSISYQTIYNVNGSLIYDYTFRFNGALNYMSFNPFLNINVSNVASNKNYYFISDKPYVRSMLLNAKTGYSESSNYSTFTFSNKSTLVNELKDNYNLYFNDKEYNNDYLASFVDNTNYGAIVSFNDGNTNIEMNGQTTLLYSKRVKDYFNENTIPYIYESEVVKNKIEASKGE